MIEGNVITLLAAEALIAHRRVKFSGGSVIYADKNDAGIGTTEYGIDDATNVGVRLDNAGGTVEMTADGAISAGGRIWPADDGKVSATINGDSIGKAVVAATADGDVIECLPQRGDDDTAASSARSRTAVQLPTAAIWNNFNLSDMRKNPFAGSLLECDFAHGENIPDSRFTDASALIAVVPGAAGVGELTLFSTADNEEACVQWTGCPITSSGGQPWAIEVRVKASQIANTKGGWFIGLMAGDVALAGDHIVDGGTLADVGAIGFQNKEGDGDIIDVVYDKAAQTQNEHDDDYVTLVADTYITLGLYYDGTTIAMYLNGVATGTAISAADIAADDFPAADILCPTFVLKNAAADDVTTYLDWIRCAQQAT